jgi:phosphopantothenate-cysteine ligase
MKVLITSGGTKIPIDRVRHIQNMSSGTFGAKIAQAALNRGLEVTFFMAENSKSPFKVDFNLHQMDAAQVVEEIGKITKKHAAAKVQKYTEVTYNSFDTYYSGLEKLVKEGNFDAIILAAAVSDYGVENYVDTKIRSNESEMQIKLKALPKIISKVKEWSHRSFLVGFKLLVDASNEELVSASMNSIKTNGCNLVIANDLTKLKNNEHEIIVVTENNGFEIFKKKNFDLADVVIRRTIEEY